MLVILQNTKYQDAYALGILKFRLHLFSIHECVLTNVFCSLDLDHFMTNPCYNIPIVNVCIQFKFNI